MNEDRFANHLDDLVTRKASGDSDDLVAFASQIQDAHGSDENDRLDSNQRSAIWRNLMAAHSHEVPTTGGPGPLSQPAMTASTAFNPWTPKRSWPHKKTTRHSIVNPYLQTAISTFALLEIIIAAFAGYTAIRDNRSPEITPTAFAAAPTQSTESVASGSPETTESEWLTYIQPEECTVEPLANDAYATIVAAPPEPVTREYGPLLPTDPETAEEVALAAREIQACQQFATSRQRQALETEQHLYGTQNGLETGLYSPSIADENVAIAKAIAEEYPYQDSAEFIFTFSEDPPAFDANFGYGYQFNLFQPRHAVTLQDGRIAIPREVVFWTGDPTVNTSGVKSWPSATIDLLVFAEEPDGWMLDEVLPFCVGDCESYWDFDPDAIEGTIVEITPPDSPASSPVAETDWLSWIKPEECTADQLSRDDYGDIMQEEPDISGRSYTPVEAPDTQSAEAAARAARAHEACSLFGSIEQQRALETAAFIFFTTDSEARTLSRHDKEMMDILNGQHLSTSFPTVGSSQYAVITTEQPPNELTGAIAEDSSRYVHFSYAFDPNNAMELTDGRVAMPVTLMYWSGDPNVPTQDQIDGSTRLSTYVVILSNSSGEWLVDEQLFFCPFEDCDAFWAEQGLPVATPGATSIATPEN